MSQTLTLTDLQERVYAHLRDDDHDIYPDDLITAWLNDGNMELAVRLDIVRREIDGLTGTGNGTPANPTDYQIALPDDFLKVYVLRISGVPVNFVTDDIWWSYSDAAVDPTQPIARYFNQNLEIYPTPDAGSDYILRYSAAPAELTAGGDVSELPPMWHPRIFAYALMQAFLKANDYYRVELWQQKYEQDLPPNPLGRERFNEGPITLGFEPGPFDLPNGDDMPILS